MNTHALQCPFSVHYCILSMYPHPWVSIGSQSIGMCVTTPVLYTRVATCRVMASLWQSATKYLQTHIPHILVSIHYLWLESWSWPSPDRRPVAASSLMIYEIGFIPWCWAPRAHVSVSALNWYSHNRRGSLVCHFIRYINKHEILQSKHLVP